MAFSNLNSEDIDDLLCFGYTIIRKVGQGTFSKVYLASYLPFSAVSTSTATRFSVSFINTMKRSHGSLACKVIEKSYKMPKNYPHRYMQRELNIMSKLQHPYIPWLHSILRKGPKFMIFMTYASGGNLCDFIVHNGPVREIVAKRWLRQLILALVYLHTMDIAHRDISCDNVLVTARYNVKLSDFSYSCFNVTIHGWPKYYDTPCGSMPYLAPEIIRGAQYNPKYSDIWSLGVVLFCMMNGTLPFTAHSYEHQYEAQMERNYYYKRQLRNIISDGAKQKVSEMLEPNALLRISLQEIFSSDWMKDANQHVPLHVRKREKRAQKNAELVKEEMDMCRGKAKYSIQYPWIRIEKESYFERLANLNKRHAMKGRDDRESIEELHFHYRASKFLALSDFSFQVPRGRSHDSIPDDISPTKSRSALTVKKSAFSEQPEEGKSSAETQSKSGQRCSLS